MACSITEAYLEHFKSYTLGELRWDWDCHLSRDERHAIMLTVMRRGVDWEWFKRQPRPRGLNPKLEVEELAPCPD